MILLQVSTDSLNNASSVISSGHNFWFYFEVVLIICVIIYQFFHSRKVFLSIEELKGIFNSRIVIKNGFIQKVTLRTKEKSIKDIVFNEIYNENAEDLNSNNEIVKISIAHTEGKGIIKQICDDINNYLINNYGADVNFANIKDIIDRQIEVKDNEISQSISTPLFLGLAATMIGIIFGLLAMPDLSAGGFSEGISALIKGVRWAMSASLIGLACTAYLSVIKYKNANKTLLKGKNEQISYLQANLLPAIIDANQTGLLGLKTQIEQFSRDAYKISSDLKETASNTSLNLIGIEKITNGQLEIVNKIDKINVAKIPRTNLELFDKLEKNLQSFNQFADYLELMGRISLQLQDFASRTSNIDSITRHIEASLSENKKLIMFLSSHFDKIENIGNAALRAVDIADGSFSAAIENLKTKSNDYFEKLFDSITKTSSKFAENIENLNNEIKTRTQTLNQNAAYHESKISEIFNDIRIKLKTITDEYIGQLNSSFKEAVPKFDELKHLTELPAIREQFTNNLNSRKFIEVVEEINESVLKVKENFNQNNLLSKLSSIEDVLKRKKSNPPKPHNESKESLRPMEETPVSIFEAITKLFKK